jgi:hypothetical protein
MDAIVELGQPVLLLGFALTTSTSVHADFQFRLTMGTEESGHIRMDQLLPLPGEAGTLVADAVPDVVQAYMDFIHQSPLVNKLVAVMDEPLSSRPMPLSYPVNVIVKPVLAASLRWR